MRAAAITLVGITNGREVAGGSSARPSADPEPRSEAWAEIADMVLQTWPLIGTAT
jgi:hypothetical protein